MRSIILFVAAIGIAAALTTRSIDKVTAGHSGRPDAMAATVTTPSSNNSRTVTIQSDRRGHFEVDARIDGRYLNALVDTGASMIALRESSAARLGIFPAARDYTARIQTANGVGRAARVRLGRVEVGNVVVHNVDAFVVSDNALSVNLLGMSFLSRVKWSHDRGRLVLEQ